MYLHSRVKTNIEITHEKSQDHDIIKYKKKLVTKR